MNFDLLYEWYFGDDGQFIVLVFYKDLKNIIVYGMINEGFDIFDGYMILIDFGGNVNLNDGIVQGIEIVY